MVLLMMMMIIISVLSGIFLFIIGFISLYLTLEIFRNIYIIKC
jgi:hypothetical protein